MINSIVLMGRITQDIELRSTTSGTSVIQFTVAVERYGKGEDKQTDFINCVAWKNTAEFISKYFGKGRMIAVTGRLQSRSYEDKNGNKRTAIEVNVNQASFTGEPKKSEEPEEEFPF